MEVLNKDAAGKPAGKSSVVIILVLLALRFPLLYAVDAGLVPMVVGMVGYLCFTYFLSGMFIWINRDHLAQHNITPSSLVLFLAAPAAALFAGNHDDFTLWIRLAAAVAFGIWWLVGRKSFSFRKSGHIFRETMVNLLLTVTMCFVVPLLVHAIRGFPKVEGEMGTGIAYLWFFQLSFAAVSEEPLFRGFIWGYFRGKGMGDGWICVIQALLFWAGHLYYIGTGINFWVVHPLVSLLIGLLAWKTKNIAYPMALHASINTFSDYLRFVSF